MNKYPRILSYNFSLLRKKNGRLTLAIMEHLEMDINKELRHREKLSKVLFNKRKNSEDLA